MKETLPPKVYEGCEMHFRQPFETDINQFRLFSICGEIPEAAKAVSGRFIIAYTILTKQQLDALTTAGVKVIIEGERTKAHCM